MTESDDHGAAFQESDLEAAKKALDAIFEVFQQMELDYASACSALTAALHMTVEKVIEEGARLGPEAAATNRHAALEAIGQMMDAIRQMGVRQDLDAARLH